MVAALVLAVAIQAAPASPCPGVASTSGAEAEIRRLEEVEWAAAVRRKDRAWFDRHLADELVMTTGRTGRVTTKAEEIADILAQEGGGDDQVTDLRVRAYGNTAIATFRLTATGSDRNGPYTRTARYTESWIHRDGRWQLAASHSSLIPSPAQ
jgi:ketosteroid isomerase-like protein